MVRAAGGRVTGRRVPTRAGLGGTVEIGGGYSVLPVLKSTGTRFMRHPHQRDRWLVPERDGEQVRTALEASGFVLEVQL